MARNVQSMHIQGAGTSVWTHTFVQLLDYLVDPTIIKKNMQVLNDLDEFIKSAQE